MKRLGELVKIMRRIMSWFALSAASTALLAGCGGSGSGDIDTSGSGTTSTVLTSYVGTTGVFTAWADPSTGDYAVASTGTAAGKRQSLRGSIDFLTGQALSQAAGVEVFKYSDGHIYAIDLTSTELPQFQQISSEAAATVDDTCSLSGTQVAGANTDYAGVYFAADLATPANSAYFYRLPGTDGTCNTADDVVHMVRTGMAATDAPVTVSAMPIATVRSASGGITGFVIKSGTQLALVDKNFANPVTLGTFGATVGVAIALPVGTTQGYPTSQLFLVDGNIVSVNYATPGISTPLLTIPGWTSTSNAASFAASPTMLYVAVNIAAAGSTPESASIYAIAADGSALPSVVDTEAAHIDSLSFPVNGTNLVWGETTPTYAVRTLAQSGGAASTVVASSVNGGMFTATATSVYLTTWTSTTDSTAKTVTHTGTSSQIVGFDGTVIQQPLANSMFAIGGEEQTWPDDTTTTATAYKTMLQIQSLSPVTATNPANGYTYTVDGVSGGTLVSINASTNTVVATIGTLPASKAAMLTGTFRDASDAGFMEATNAASTNDPATRDLYLLNTQIAADLLRATSNL